MLVEMPMSQAVKVAEGYAEFTQALGYEPVSAEHYGNGICHLEGRVLHPEQFPVEHGCLEMDVEKTLGWWKVEPGHTIMAVRLWGGTAGLVFCRVGQPLSMIFMPFGKWLKVGWGDADGQHFGVTVVPND